MKETVQVVEQTPVGVVPSGPVTVAGAVAPSGLRRASWGAIFAGMFFTTVLQVMFTLLGMAVGFGPLRPTQQANPGQAMAIGSGIWLLVTGLVSIWIGACVAGRLSGGPRRADGMIHGLISWSVSVIVAFALLASTVGAVVGGTAALVNGAIASNGGGQQTAASLGQDVKAIFPQTGTLLSPTGRTQGPQVPGKLTDLAKQDSQLATAVAKMEANGGASKSQADRDQVVNLLTSKHNLNQQDAENLVNQWDQQFQQVRGQASQEAKQVGQNVAHGLAQGALWGFIALFLGLLVAAWGGWAGTASLPRSSGIIPAAGV